MSIKFSLFLGKSSLHSKFDHPANDGKFEP